MGIFSGFGIDLPCRMIVPCVGSLKFKGEYGTLNAAAMLDSDPEAAAMMAEELLAEMVEQVELDEVVVVIIPELVVGVGVDIS